TIDTIDPQVTITFDNNDFVLNDDKAYFKKARVATITVDDVNFEGTSDMVTVTALTNDGVSIENVPQILWNGNVGTINFSDNANYALSINDSFKDKAERSSQIKVDQDTKYAFEFVIDEDAPIAKISYDNNDSLVADGYYYQANRVATITVDDVNFKGETDMVIVTAKDVTGADLETVPQISWNGNIGTIKFTEDAHYTLTITDKFVDKAGTKADVSVVNGTKDAYAFAVDKVNPENLKIEYKSEKDSLFGTILDLIEKATGGFIYFSDDIEVTVTSTDITSGIDRIEYSAPLYEGSKEVETQEINNTIVKNEDSTAESFSTTFKVPAEYKGTIQAVVYDRAGRSTSSAEESGVVVSKKKPEITLDVVNSTDAVVHDEISYYNEDIKIKVTVEDVFFDSSKVVITETTDGNSKKVNAESWIRVSDDTNKYETTITLSSEGVKTLKVEYTNNSKISAVDKLVENIVIDKTAPKVTIKYDNNTSLVNGYYYNKARTATITVDDINFKGETDMVKVTAVDKAGKTVKSVPEIIWEGKVGTIKFTDDAYYVLSITDKFVDKAGTKAEVSVVNGTNDAYDFVVDKSNPDVGTISVKDQNSKEIDLSNKEQNHTEIIYSNMAVNVSITSNDVLTKPTIEYFISSSYLECKNITGWETYTGSIKLEPDRKFVLYTKISDQAGNYIYRTTNIIILDKTNPDIDGVAPDIKLNPSSNQQKVDKNSNILYNGDVKVDYVITDPIVNNSCAGLNLEKLTYKVVCDGKVTQSGKLNGTVTEYDGRVGSYKGTITVDSKLNNSNNVQLVVDATDNATNHSDSTADLRIDITAPTINVNWDKTSDSEHTKYFRETRTAIITIRERNFDADDVVVTMTKDGDEYSPSLSWNSTGTAGTDSYSHIAEININSDGDYTFDISYVDEATNKAGEVNYGSSVSPREFTIDLNRPEITVNFDNNSAQNGNYYNNHRTATITVNEHNFDPSRFVYSCVATDDGATVSSPALGSWTSSGDVHTAIVNFNSDAKFTLEV
ncbi:MAG: hypothetical protein UHD05_07450, partial [Ruminococcus sp.]|nr:hypothetical protein [Ruminococcus sp.]